MYCHMQDLGNCGGGEWTLVMKTDGIKVIAQSSVLFCLLVEIAYRSFIDDTSAQAYRNAKTRVRARQQDVSVI